jgi:lipopolysaccharide/colanic/teichoic acid biosynthesis glycosyltransferase
VSYVKNQSLWLDIKVLSKTLKAVLKMSGAY